jgi:hypothetical protein
MVQLCEAQHKRSIGLQPHNGQLATFKESNLGCCKTENYRSTQDWMH